MEGRHPPCLRRSTRVAAQKQCLRVDHKSCTSVYTEAETGTVTTTDVESAPEAQKKERSELKALRALCIHNRERERDGERY
jgi:hypothetical protein